MTTPDMPVFKKYLHMCGDAFEAVEQCFQSQGVDPKDEKAKFPPACIDLAVAQMECSVAKREVAIQSAEKLAGKESVKKAFPYYEEQKQKTLDLIEIYKNNLAGGKLNKDDAFWQPANK